MSVLESSVVRVRRIMREGPRQSALRNGLQLTICLAAAVIMAGCQAFVQPAAAPTPTPILLSSAIAASPTAQHPASLATAVLPAVSPSQASPTAASETSATPVARTPRIMALGLSSAVVLRAAPQAGAAVVAQVPGSDVLKAEGRSADGKWFWVAFGKDEASSAWVAAAAVKLLGDAATLPVVEKTAAAPTRTTASAASAPGARAATPVPLAGKIAFATSIGGDIYLVNADGTGLRRVAAGIDPALSPDGTRLAYTRWDSPNSLYVLNLATNEERRVAQTNRPRSPTWNSDGSWLAFIRQTRNYNCLQTPIGCFPEDQVRSFFGGQECQVMQGRQYCISDFEVRIGQEYALVRVDAVGGGWLDISSTTDVQSLSWRPQGAEILYRGGGGLQIATAGSAARPLVQDAAYSSPVWSPDGQRIAVQVHMHDHADIFLLDAVGRNLTRLTAPPADAKVAPNNVAPAWSPDGAYIVFLSDRDGAWHLYRMNADGSGQALLLPQALGGVALKYDFAAERVVSWSK